MNKKILFLAVRAAAVAGVAVALVTNLLQLDSGVRGAIGGAIGAIVGVLVVAKKSSGNS
jgi:hypothetical protein